jgi:hypothetical protein
MAFTKSLGGKSLHYGVRRRKVMRSMSQTGLGRVEMPDRVGIEGGRWCGVGYALIAAISGPTPMMFMTQVRL